MDSVVPWRAFMMEHMVVSLTLNGQSKHRADAELFGGMGVKCAAGVSAKV